jgi:hypothetical protein
MIEYSIERKKAYKGPFDFLIKKNNDVIFNIEVIGWFAQYNFYDARTHELISTIMGGTESWIFPITRILLYDENTEMSMRNNIFATKHRFNCLGRDYFIHVKIIEETEIFENGILVLKMINTQKNTLYSGSVKVFVEESDNMLLLFMLLIWYCSDFSWTDS